MAIVKNNCTRNPYHCTDCGISFTFGHYRLHEELCAWVMDSELWVTD